MEKDIILKTSFRGFNKKAVMDYIEKLQKENQALKARVAELEEVIIRDDVEVKEEDPTGSFAEPALPALESASMASESAVAVSEPSSTAPELKGSVSESGRLDFESELPASASALPERQERSAAGTLSAVLSFSKETVFSAEERDDFEKMEAEIEERLQKMTSEFAGKAASSAATESADKTSAAEDKTSVAEEKTSTMAEDKTSAAEDKTPATEEKPAAPEKKKGIRIRVRIKD